MTDQPFDPVPTHQMPTHEPPSQPPALPPHAGHVGTARRRLSAETKESYKTSELAIYVVVFLGILIASAVTDTADFGAQEAWWFITLLSIGYFLSRGLAKLGSRNADDDRDARHNG